MDDDHDDGDGDRLLCKSDKIDEIVERKRKRNLNLAPQECEDDVLRCQQPTTPNDTTFLVTLDVFCVVCVWLNIGWTGATDCAVA